MTRDTRAVQEELTGKRRNLGGRVCLLSVIWVVAVLLAACSSSSPVPAIEVTGPVSLLDLFPQARKKTEAQEDWRGFIHITSVEIEGKRDRALFLHPKSEIAFPLRIERAAILETAIALVPEAWEKQSDGVTFYVAIREEDELLPTYVFRSYLSPQVADVLPGWRVVRIDLSPYQGANIELIFGTDPGPNDNPLYDWAIWKEPHVYNPATDTEPFNKK